MYSKEEAQRIKQEFWVAFDEVSPRKWIRYDTKIKDFSFKFGIDRKRIEVGIYIEHKDSELRTVYYQKIESLKSLLETYFTEELLWDSAQILDNGKEIAKIWVEKHGLTVMNRKHWEVIFDFFITQMDAFEHFFWEYEEYIRNLEINT
jgi:hypothetical protein